MGDTAGPDPIHDAAHWDQRYAAADPGPGRPDATVVAILQPLEPGPALDLAAGRGRHAHWLADHGWAVTAVDFSAVGIAEATTRQPATTEIAWVVADVRTWAPEPDTRYRLVLCAYLHLDPPELARVRSWLAPGGRLVVVSHAPDAGDGPRNPAYRYDEAQLRAAATGLKIERLDQGDGRIALVARQPG